VIEVRTITKPFAGTVKVDLDGIEQLSGWSVDTTTGLVTISTAPAWGIEATADFEFHVPVRFDTDHMAVTIETYRLHAWQQIPDPRAQRLINAADGRRQGGPQLRIRQIVEFRGEVDPHLRTRGLVGTRVVPS
jgi:hypothetical protein